MCLRLIVFVGFLWLVLKEQLDWNHLLGFALIAAGAGVVFLGRWALLRARAPDQPWRADDDGDHHFQRRREQIEARVGAIAQH